MKTATIIFVALTVFSGLFLETSTAPSILTSISEKVKNDLDVVGKGFKKLLGSDIAKLIKDLTALNELLNLEELKDVKEPLKELLELVPTLLIEVEKGNTVAVQKQVGKLREIIERIKETIAKLWEKVGDDAKEILGKLRQALKKLVEKLVELLKPIIKDIVEVVKNLASKLKEVLGGILKKIKELIANCEGELKELYNKVKAVLQKIIQKILDWINALEAAASNVTNDSLDVVDGHMKGIKAVLAEIKNLDLSTVAKDIKDLITSLLEDVDSLVSKNVGILEEIKKLLATVADEIEAIIDVCLLGDQDTKEIGENLKIIVELEAEIMVAVDIAVVQDLWGKISKSIEKIKAIIAKIVAKLGDETKELLRKVVQAVKKVVERIREVLKPKLKELVSKVKQLLEKIKDAIGNCEGDLKELLIKLAARLREKLVKIIEKILDLIDRWELKELHGHNEELKAEITELNLSIDASVSIEIKDLMTAFLGQVGDLSVYFNIFVEIFGSSIAV